MITNIRSDRAALLLVLAVAATNGVAAERAARDAEEPGFRYSLRAGATHSDNIGRTSSFETSETSADVGLTAGWVYRRERAEATLDVDLDYSMHNYATYGNVLNGGLAARASYDLWRDVVHWVVEDNLAQSLIDPLSTVTPENTQNLNVLSSGPDIRVPLGPRTDVLIQGRWSDVSYQDSDYGNRRLSGLFGVSRQTGDRSSLSLNGTAESVNYKSLPSSSNYNIYSGYLGWDGVGAKTRLNVRAGFSTLRDDADSASGGIYALDLTRQISLRTSFSLHAGRSFGDASDSIRREQGIRGVSVGTRPAETSSDPMRTDYASASWDADSGRSTVRIFGDWRRERHQRDSTYDGRKLEGRLQIGRRLSPRFTVTFSTGLMTQDYEQVDVDFTEWGTALDLAWAFTNAVGIRTTWDHLVGSGDTAVRQGSRAYTENRYTIYLTWTPRTEL